MAQTRNQGVKPGMLVKAIAKGNKQPRQYEVVEVKGNSVTMREGWYDSESGLFTQSESTRDAERIVEVLADSAPKVGSERPAKATAAAE